VPFKPNGEKPVLCRNCFSPNQDRKDFGRRNDRRDSRPVVDNSKLQEQINALHTKVDKLLEALQLGKFEEKIPMKKTPKKEKPTPEELTKAIEDAISESEE
jgi:hypothetical protein